jgi:hypothetical protein
MLSVVMLSVVMLSVFMLRVVAPIEQINNIQTDGSHTVIDSM